MSGALKPRYDVALRRNQVEEVIKAISEGGFLRGALKAVGLSQQLFHDFLSKERELAVRYARAQEIRADLLADEVVEIADNPDIDPIRARNMLEARRWRAKTLNPKVYGERLDLNVSQTIDVLGTLTEARARIGRPVYDQQAEPIDVTPIESSTSEPGATDKESVSDDAPPVPDIFS